MAHSHVIFGAGLETARPTVRTIGLNDLKDALMRGLDDFGAMPSHAVFLCLIYPIVGFVLYRLRCCSRWWPALPSSVQSPRSASMK